MSGKFYRIGLVGERNYQTAIAACAEGDRVAVLREPDNPYDEKAIAVASADGRTIGYIPRDNFLQRAVHKERQGCEAEIVAIDAGAKGLRGVVIEVELIDGPLGERAFVRR